MQARMREQEARRNEVQQFQVHCPGVVCVGTSELDDRIEKTYSLRMCRISSARRGEGCRIGAIPRRYQVTNLHAKIHPRCLQWSEWRTRDSIVDDVTENRGVENRGIVDYLTEDDGGSYRRSIHQFDEVWRERIFHGVIEDSKDMDARNDKENTAAAIDSNHNAHRRMISQLSKEKDTQCLDVDEQLVRREGDTVSGALKSGLTARGRELDEYGLTKLNYHATRTRRYTYESDDDCNDEYTQPDAKINAEQRWCWADDWFSAAITPSPISSGSVDISKSRAQCCF